MMASIKALAPWHESMGRGRNHGRGAEIYNDSETGGSLASWLRSRDCSRQGQRGGSGRPRCNAAWQGWPLTHRLHTDTIICSFGAAISGATRGTGPRVCDTRSGRGVRCGVVAMAPPPPPPRPHIEHAPLHANMHHPRPCASVGRPTLSTRASWQSAHFRHLRAGEGGGGGGDRRGAGCRCAPAPQAGALLGCAPKVRAAVVAGGLLQAVDLAQLLAALRHQAGQAAAAVQHAAGLEPAHGAQLLCCVPKQQAGAPGAVAAGAPVIKAVDCRGGREAMDACASRRQPGGDGQDTACGACPPLPIPRDTRHSQRPVGHFLSSPASATGGVSFTALGRHAHQAQTVRTGIPRRRRHASAAGVAPRAPLSAQTRRHRLAQSARPAGRRRPPCRGPCRAVPQLTRPDRPSPRSPPISVF